MSQELYKKLDETVDQMIEEYSSTGAGKLTIPALAQKAGVSVSTVNRGEYTAVRSRLRAAKPARVHVSTNEDAVEWRLKYYQQQKDYAEKREADREVIAELKETVEGLVQKVQALSLTK